MARPTTTARRLRREQSFHRSNRGAREKFDVETVQAEDPLNTTVQATRRAMRIHYLMRADVQACPNQRKSGIHNLKPILGE